MQAVVDKFHQTMSFPGGNIRQWYSHVNNCSYLYAGGVVLRVPGKFTHNKGKDGAFERMFRDERKFMFEALEPFYSREPRVRQPCAYCAREACLCTASGKLRSCGMCCYGFRLELTKSCTCDLGHDGHNVWEIDGVLFAAHWIEKLKRFNPAYLRYCPDLVAVGDEMRSLSILMSIGGVQVHGVIANFVPEAWPMVKS